jgi:Txe/YoeB family toxin of Txe-Axe toxin-antitoxin module
MTTDSAEAALSFSRFYAMLQDGIERIFEAMKRDAFTFVVNGEKFKSTLTEAFSLNLRAREFHSAFHGLGRFPFSRFAGCLEMSSFALDCFLR